MVSGATDTLCTFSFDCSCSWMWISLKLLNRIKLTHYLILLSLYTSPEQNSVFHVPTNQHHVHLSIFWRIWGTYFGTLSDKCKIVTKEFPFAHLLNEEFGLMSLLCSFSLLKLAYSSWLTKEILQGIADISTQNFRKIWNFVPWRPCITQRYLVHLL